MAALHLCRRHGYEELVTHSITLTTVVCCSAVSNTVHLLLVVRIHLVNKNVLLDSTLCYNFYSHCNVCTFTIMNFELNNSHSLIIMCCYVLCWL